ncbi:MAG: hypothetical protein MUC94_07115, partial [bacterium]|nr:hypothetical protein [bacterium]
AAMRNITVAQQVDKIVAILDTECARKQRQTPAVVIHIMRWWKKFKSIFEISIFAERRWTWATAFVCILLVIGFFGYHQSRNWQGYLLTNKAIESLTQEYFITEENLPRPMGGFRFSIIGATRSRDEAEKMLPMKNNLVRAAKLNPDNSATHEYLGTYYLLIENDLDQANHHYQIAYQINPTSADILNDLGVLALYHKNYETAISYLLEAQQYQPQLLEAQYNLIIAYSGIGKIEEARQAREKYKALDPTISWYEISKSLIDTSNMK